MIELYTTNCPNCKILEALMERAQIPYIKIESTPEDMLNRGWQTAPMLILADGTECDYPKAFKWIRQETGK